MVQGEWCGDKRLAAKDNQPDAVIGTFSNESLQHILGNGDAIDLLAVQSKALVFGSHAPGEIQRYYNVNAAGTDRSLATGQLWARQSDNQDREDKPAHG